MSAYGWVHVGPHAVVRIEEGSVQHLLAVFRDDAVVERAAASSAGGAGEQELIFKMAGSDLADRLDVLGSDVTSAFEALVSAARQQATWHADNPEIREQIDPSGRQRDFLLAMDGPVWIEAIRAASLDPERRHLTSAYETDIGWLLEIPAALDYRDALRLGLLAFPDQEVTLNLTDRGEGWIENFLQDPASKSLQSLQLLGANFSPMVVLTEGRTDAEFLQSALRILFPHLADLVRFLEFDTRVDGGAAALVRMVKSFAAAGIQNRIVAIFDNDTAAAEARRPLNNLQLPPNIAVIEYPEISSARNYPTMGPPTLDNPSGLISSADVNGLAGSIELYLGHDVLKREDGTLRPVQWKTFMSGVGRYHGEVMEKAAIQDSYRAKVATAVQNNGRPVSGQDWTDLEALLVHIVGAHRRLKPESSRR